MYQINYDTSIHILKTPIPTLCGVKWGGVGWGGVGVTFMWLYSFLIPSRNSEHICFKVTFIIIIAHMNDSYTS